MWLNLWTFAFYWWIKSNELSEKRAEIRAITKNSALSSGTPKQAGDSAPKAGVPAQQAI
jgi:hypothetical protein